VVKSSRKGAALTDCRAKIPVVLQCHSEELRILGKFFSLRALRLCAMRRPGGFGCGSVALGLLRLFAAVHLAMPVVHAEQESPLEFEPAPGPRHVPTAAFSDGG